MGRFDDEDDLSESGGDLSDGSDVGDGDAASTRPRLSAAERGALLDDLEVKVCSGKPWGVFFLKK